MRVVASLSFLSGSVALYLYQYLQCLFLHIVDIITHMLDLMQNICVSCTFRLGNFYSQSEIHNVESFSYHIQIFGRLEVLM